MGLVDLNPVPQLPAFWGEVFAQATVWVAEDAGRVAGFCWREDDGTIGALHAATAARSAGLGLPEERGELAALCP